ncbi:protein DEK-like [Salvelinus namaycush]|uniref:Protein DEK-like n=1 Tax=Salvelinus namaycush TaxID=8040 RepID=A0A8U1H4Z5_SALNM|nr:protein DEK-like [Salvelinus namaycush]
MGCVHSTQRHNGKRCVPEPDGSTKVVVHGVPVEILQLAEIEAMRKAKIRRLMQRKTVLLSESDDDITDDSSDDEPLVKMMTRKPSNEELKTTVKKLVAHVDLEKVTMKDIFKKVFKMYPRHDLSNKKSYIKETVKKLLSQ